MLRPKNILVGLDNSPAAENALTQAIDLGLWSKGKVTALTVTPPYEGDLSLVGIKRIRNVLSGFDGPAPEDILKSARGRGIHVQDAHAQGDPADEMVRWTEHNPCDLVVLGANEAYSLSKALLQSILARVMAKSSCSLLVVPRKSRLSWGKIVLFLPARVSPLSWRQFLNSASDFATSFEGRIHATASIFPIPVEQTSPSPRNSSCFDFGQSTGVMAKREKESASTSRDRVMVSGRASRNIEWIGSQSPDLIFTGILPNKGLERIRALQMLERLIRSALCPVWVQWFASTHH